MMVWKFSMCDFVGNTIEAKPIKAPLRTAAAQSLIHDEHVKPKFVTAAIDELVKTEGKDHYYRNT